MIKPALANRQKVPFESQQNAFLYSSYFHPELDYSYSIKSIVDTENCGGGRIIPSEAVSQ